MPTLRCIVGISAAFVALTMSAGCRNATPPAPAPVRGATNAAADALLKRVSARYGNAKSYRDKGTGTTRLGTLGTTKLDFDTAFVRGGGFLWRCTNDLLPGGNFRRASVVWSTDATVWNFWMEVTKETKQFNSLSMALAGPTGISYGLARIVPGLLLPERGGSTFLIGLTSPNVVATETLDSVECDVLEGGILGMDGKTTLWIDATGAIRKYRQSMTVDPSKVPPPPGGTGGPPAGMTRAPFETVTEFVFEPEFDVEVSPSDTAFTPPS